MSICRDNKIAFSFRLSLILYILLLGALLFRHYQTIVLGQYSLMLSVLTTLPLLLVFVGVLRGTSTSFIWLCFIILFYFTHGVTVIFSDAGSWYGWLASTLTVLLFISALLYIRWQHQASV